MKREFLDSIEDIVNSITDIEKFIARKTLREFSKDKQLVLAVVKSLEIIGEATKNIPAHIRKQHPEVPWRDIAGMRDKLVHEYWGIDMETVWKTARNDAPSAKPFFQKILSEHRGNKKK